MSFEIKLPLFEGPFDLLLFFIERDELDIHDIPISTITNDFLSYLHELDQMNIEVASEFILVAATLMRIKAKVLLPRPVLNEEGEEIDPRDELVKHLLEYKKYKSVVQELAAMEEERMQQYERGNVMQELRALAQEQQVETELQHVDLYKLLKVYEKVWVRFTEEKKDNSHRVVQYPYTVEGQKGFIRQLLSKQPRDVSFVTIIEHNPNKIAVIFNFLAILELLQISEITIKIGEGYNNFWVYRTEDAEQA
ncbi:segregation and condensation protein A [Tunicatimonas pelagia]|uniref:segregation and condensation protein A n=1 Tax=Tunicatimonas pelagia TaxID=931531 RepID=UPI00266656C0|nr:segregation/condensation protein A [Tunicatimonas pelagia]WKN45880.1 segregation/condensation protein A [Tunicatimonas pelagia]